MKIGIPDTFFDHLIQPFWQTFFSSLGCRIVRSKIDRNKLPLHTVNFENELCLPIKFYLAQCMDLLNKDINYLFAPQVYSLNAKSYCCPKVIMAPEMLSTYLDPNIKTPVISPFIGLSQDGWQLLDEFKGLAYKLGASFSKNGLEVQSAIEDAEQAHTAIKKKMISGSNNLLVVGHRYSVNDKVLSYDFISKLKSYGFSVVTKEDLDIELSDTDISSITGLDAHLYFSEGISILKSIDYAINSDQIKGIVYLGMFNCGLDAFMEDIVSTRIINNSTKPYKYIVLDEHSSGSNIATSIELFAEVVNES